jgi:ribosomal protein S18 acetylase RimI-like enzyme
MVTVCVFTTLTGRKAFLDHLVVAEDWRRRGVARALMQHAIEVAAAAGASRLDLTASERKAEARALYASLGFHERATGSFRLELL